MSPGAGTGGDASPVRRTGLELVGHCVLNHQARRELLIAGLVAWAMVLVALTVCVGLLASAGAASVTVGTAALGTATVAGTTAVIRRRPAR